MKIKFLENVSIATDGKGYVRGSFKKGDIVDLSKTEIVPKVVDALVESERVEVIKEKSAKPKKDK